MQARKKGTDLERAIAIIENAILKSVPTLSDKSYKIFSQKIITVDGVKHEIDIWVEFEIGGGYKSTFIFESKNWRKKIGKNHIIVFSEKINAAKAQKGFFVAKSLTKYAVAASKLNPRMTVLKVKQDFVTSDVINTFHHLWRDKSKMTTNVLFVSDRPAAYIVGDRTPAPVDTQRAEVLLNGTPIDCQAYISRYIDETVEEHVNQLPTNLFPAGTYSYDLEKEIVIAPDQLVVNDLVIHRVKLDIKSCVEVVRPPIVSKYEVETRGRIYMFDTVKHGDVATAQVTFVETLRN